MQSQAKKVAYYGIFAAFALILSYVESLIPLPIPVPGIKIGLANIAVLLTLYMMDAKSALGISIVRIALSALLFSGFAGFLYSAAGALASLGIMVLAKRTEKLPAKKGISIIGVSVLGGITHNAAQLCVAIAVVQTMGLMYYFPALLAAGVVTGIFIGIAAKAALLALGKKAA
ncbi:MAG: Gx transporter family protein [Firmicutes bacterium]|nr:Gx transporter family protein [Bacillota bacterium]